MKIRIITLLGAASFALSQAAFSQGNFQNLDFENATIVSDPSSLYYPYDVYANQAIPGWTVYLGNAQTSLVLYNDMTLGNASVDIFGPGNYSIALQAGNYKGQIVSASISQTGLIPAGTQSLFFESSTYEPVEVYIGNQLIPITAMKSGADTTLYGANISAWAGQTKQLTFTSESFASTLDDISFSTTAAVPEPGTCALFFFGLGGLLGWKKMCIKRE